MMENTQSFIYPEHQPTESYEIRCDLFRDEQGVEPPPWDRQSPALPVRLTAKQRNECSNGFKKAPAAVQYEK
uniref:Uncharacterized protein n=1 Tax=Caenorhabditis tropicalis TaxID=1561998 RepID=A0A1I7T613_9PELO